MSAISATSAIANQASLLVLSLSVILTRVYVRIVLESRSLQLPDYLTVIGWLLTLGWVICTAISFELGALDDDDDDTSIALLKLFYASNFFFDIGTYFPKFSILAFYWNLIPSAYRTLRRALYLTTAYVSVAFVCAVSLDTFWCYPISNNWYGLLQWLLMGFVALIANNPLRSPTYQDASVWNSWVVFRTNYSFNLSADIFVFILPFFILPHLKLPPREIKCLIGVFSLGLITIIISISRFAWENLNLDVASGDVWCTAEISVALIVVSLPSLKTLLKDCSQRGRQHTVDVESAGSTTVVRPWGDNTHIEMQIRNNYYKKA